MIADVLKKSVLQAAIQGKLTEQLPEDGDARDLLEEIRKEKAQLIREGKLKKEKPLPEITDEEIPFDIPDNWVWVRLGDIGVWSAGLTPSRTRDDYYRSGTIPWIKTGDLNDGYVTESDERITEKAVLETNIVLREVGTVMLALYGATIGKIGILRIRSAMNQACCGCTTYSGVFNRFLFYYLLFQKDNFKKQSFGGAQPNISKAKVILNLIPLPPLSEQKRIVELLDQLLPLCDSLD